MTDIMSLGLSSVRAYTNGLATISDNVANAQTPGYARRSVRIEDATVIRYSDEWRNSEANRLGPCEPGLDPAQLAGRCRARA